LLDTIHSFKDKRIIIIGDVMIDAYIWGKHERMSPEAPVHVVDVERREARLGGAANVALNIQGAGASPVVITILGAQGRATELQQLLLAQDMTDEGLVWSNGRICTVKTRVISNGKHMLRVDEEQTDDISPEEEDALLDRLKSIIENSAVDAAILQDYNKGVLTERVIRESIAMCKEKGITITVDPKKKNFMAFKGCDLFKPNLKELREGLDTDIQAEKDSLDEALKELQKLMPHERTMITLSEHGVYHSEKGISAILPAHKRNIVDVSGAGDTVIAIATLALASGSDLAEAAWLANLAGGLVCEKVGVQPITQEALLNETMSIRQ
jgi:rfaE bifunctional protein kinase chain/domain